MVNGIAFAGIVAAVYFLFFFERTQLCGRVLYRVKTTRPVVALSFDDGPNEPYTSQLLDVLQRHQVKATFFVVGQNAERFPDAVKKTAVMGHEIGNHSYSHSFLAPVLHPNFRMQLQKTQDVLFQLTGRTPVLFRPPWFFRQPWMLQSAKHMGLATVTGTFGSNAEVFQIDAAQIAATALRRTKPGAILVFHDGYDNKTAFRQKTVEAVDVLIAQLKQRGYRCVTVSELMRESA